MIRTDDVTRQVFNRAVAMIRGQAWVARLTGELTPDTGRPRDLTWESFFILLQIAALEGDGKLLLIDVARVAKRLDGVQRHELGLSPSATYRQIECALSTLEAALSETIDMDTGEVTPPRLSMPLAELTTHIVADFIPAAIPATSTLSIDSTDHETWSARKSWSKGNRPDTSAESLPEDADPSQPSGANAPGWPKVGADGRLMHTLDPNAREGYRSGKNRRRKETFIGWDLHLATDTPAMGGNALAPLARGFVAAPAGTIKSEPGLALLDALEACHRKPSTIIVDRGYSYLKGQHWARPVDERGITQVFDLHPNQRRQHPGPIPGTIFLDGDVFLDTLPEGLRNLPGFGLGQKASEKALLTAEYDKRARYAFRPFGRHDHTRGTQRYRGPALTKRVICPNHPETQRLDPTTHPQSGCVKGEPCACGATLTLGPDETDYFSMRQQDLYGTTAWTASYGRRSSVESANSVLKTHHGRLSRGSTRVRGTIKNTLLAAFLIAAANIGLLESRYGYDVAEPPADDRERIEPLPSPRSALHRRRAFSRRRARSKDPDTAPPGKPGRRPQKPITSPTQWKRATETTVAD